MEIVPLTPERRQAWEAWLDSLEEKLRILGSLDSGPPVIRWEGLTNPIADIERFHRMVYAEPGAGGDMLAGGKL